MIARVEFDYKGREAIVALAKTDEGYAALSEIIAGAPARDRASSEWAWPSETLLDMETDGRRLTSLGVEFTVKSFKGTLPLKTVLPEGENITVYVQIPHIGLLAVNEVQVLENCCTNELQRALDEGWRILCVCPPNATRRPDHILGRTKEGKQ